MRFLDADEALALEVGADLVDMLGKRGGWAEATAELSKLAWFELC